MNKIAHKYQRYLKLQGRRTSNFRYAFKHLYLFLNSPDELYYLTVERVQNFQSHLIESTKLSEATVSIIIGILSSFYDYLREQSRVGHNPFTLIDRIRIPKKLPSHIPDEKEMSSLLNHLGKFARGKDLREYRRDYKLHVLCELLYSTGMRIGEASALRVEDVDLDESSILILDVKSHSQRLGFLNEYARGVLKIYIRQYRMRVLWLHNRADEKLLFGAKCHLKLWINGLLEQNCRELGITKITAHHFRHAFGYHLLRAGCDIRIIQGLLGHRRLDSTGVYTKVDKQALRTILDRYHPRKGK